MHKEQMKTYINEKFPKTTYKKTYKYSIRPRKPGEIFIGEILFALFLIFMLIMLYLNYEATQNYQTNNNKKNITQIDVNIEITNEQNLYSNNLAEMFFFNEFKITSTQYF